MTRRPNLRVSAVLVAASALLFTACGSSDSSSNVFGNDGTPKVGGNLVDLQNFAGGAPDHIDPALANAVQTSQIAALLYDGLTKPDATGTIQNAVAETITPNSDATVWTFKLRNGVKFDNGDPVLPSSFKFAWERVLTPSMASKLTYHFDIIKGSDEMEAGTATTLSGVEADDAANTLTVTLKSAYRDFPSVVSIPVFSPLPQAAVTAATDGWESGPLIGNGPYKMTAAWNAQSTDIKLARSDTYYGGSSNHRAYLDSVDFKISQDIASAYKDFDSGQGQVGRIPPGQYQAVVSAHKDQVVNTPLLETEYWGFNLNDATVGGAGNAKLRQAIALVIDKKDISDKLYGNSRPVATGWAPPGTPGYKASNDKGDTDVNQARSLLTEWGKPLPTIKLSFATGAGHDDQASIIQQNLAAVGITATPDPQSRQDYGKAVHTGAVQMFWGAWTADYPLYDNFVFPQFDSASIGSDNAFNYNNAQLDSLVATARSSSDKSKREDLYRQAEKMALADQVLIPIDWATAGVIKANNVKGFAVEPLGYVSYADTWMSS